MVRARATDRENSEASYNPLHNVLHLPISIAMLYAKTIFLPCFPATAVFRHTVSPAEKSSQAGPADANLIMAFSRGKRGKWLAARNCSSFSPDAARRPNEIGGRIVCIR